MEKFIFCNSDKTQWYFKKYKEQLFQHIPMFKTKQEAIEYKHQFLIERNKRIPTSWLPR